MTFAQMKLIAIFTGALALAACGGGVETESFSVALSDVDVVDAEGATVDVDVSRISQSGKLAAE